MPELSEAAIRLIIFAGLFLALASMEWFVPRRKLRPVKTARWFTNLSIVIIDSILVRFRIGNFGHVGSQRLVVSHIIR